MIALTNANPDFYRTIVRSDGTAYNKKTLIYSTLKNLLIGQDYPGGNEHFEGIPDNTDLTIQAITLTLFGTIKIPGADVKIYCKKLILWNDLGATIDVSSPNLDPRYRVPFKITEAAPDNTGGKSGVIIAQEKDPLYGTAGHKGGSIEIICDELELRAPLILKSNGGQGYAGCDGQKGGDSTTPNDQGRRGGDAQSGGAGGDGGSIHVKYRVVDNISNLKAAEVSGGVPGVSGTPGQGGRSAKGELNGLPGNCAPSPLYGENGVYSFSEYEKKDRHIFGEACDEIFMLKAVQRAKLTYLQIQPESYQEHAIIDEQWSKGWAALGDLMNWIQEALASFKAISSGENSYEAQRKNNLYSIISSYVTRYSNLLNYFGKAPNYVPTMVLKIRRDEEGASLTKEEFIKKYKPSLFDNLVSSQKSIEEKFLKLAKKYENAQEASIDKEEHTAQLKYTIDYYQKAYNKAIEQFRDPNGISLTVETTLSKATTCQTNLQRLLEGVKDTIKNVLNFNVEDILEALASFAFTGGEGLAGLMTGAISGYNIYDSVVNNISDDKDNSIKKSSLIKEIVTFDKAALNFQNIREALFTEKNGKITLTDPGKYILTTLDQFDDLINNFKNALGSKLTEEVSHALEHYKAAIYEKGNAQFIYTSCVLSAANAYKAYKVAEEELEATKKPEKSEITPSATRLLSHYAMLYQERLDDLVEFVYLLRREYAYITFKIEKTEKRMDDVIKLLAPIWAPEIASDNVIDFTTLDKEVSSIFEKLCDYYSSQVSPEYYIPKIGSNERGTLFSISITKESLLEYFNNNKNITFRIIPTGTTEDYKNKKITNGYSDKFPRDKEGNLLFEAPETKNFNDIRVLNVQPRVYGVTGTKAYNGRPPSVELQITASTEKGVQNQKGEMFLFSHEIPRLATFAHRIDTTPDEINQNDIVQGLDGHITGDCLDALGLFGCWTLVLPAAVNENDINSGANLSSITKITFYFSVIAYPTPRASLLLNFIRRMLK